MHFYALLPFLIILPWLNGGLDLEIRAAIYSLVLVYVVFGCFAAFQAKCFRFDRLFGLLLVGLVWAVLQLVPVDTSLPATSLRLWQTLAGADVGTVSLNPSETRIQLALFIASCAVFFVSSQVRLSDWQVYRLAYSVLANGALITVFAIVQRYQWNGKLYWFLPIPANETVFGPFVYHNAAAAYLALCLGCGWYVLQMNWVRSWRELLETKNLLVVLLIATSVVGLVCSMSRGAILAVAVATVVIVIISVSKSRERSGQWQLVLPIALVIAGLLFWFGMTSSVVDRLGTLTERDVLLNDGRLKHWADAIVAARDYWGLGCGLGAYGQVVSMYETSTSPTLSFSHAHNHYLETFITTGLLGLLLTCLCVIDAFRMAMSSMASASKQYREWGTVAVFVVVFQLLHSTIDYCLFVPASCLTLAILCGICASFSDAAVSQRSTSLRLGYGCWLLLILGVSWAVFDSFGAAKVELAIGSLPWKRAQADLSEEEVAAGLQRMSKAIAWRPDSMKGQESIALLHVVRYRQMARKQLAAETKFDESDPNLWQWTSPEVLQHRVHTLIREERPSEIEELKREPIIRESLLPARSALLASRASCPLWPAVHLRLEESAFLDDVLPVSSDMNAQRVLAVAGKDATILFECGKREFGAGRYETAYKCWKRSLNLSTKSVGEIARLGLQHLDTEGLLAKVVPSKVGVLVAISELRGKEGMPSNFRSEIAINAAKELIKDSPPTDADSFFMTARVAYLNGQLAESVKNLERALRLKPHDVEWRFALGQQLAESGRVEEAERELVTCVRLKKANRYVVFLNDLRKRKATKSD